MKAWVLNGIGGADFGLRELPDPSPGPGEVLVRLRAASINYRDLLILKGGYGSWQKRENLILLSDGAGEIEAVGAGVDEWKVGDRVAGCFLPDWLDGPPGEQTTRRALGGLLDGVAAHYRVFGRDHIVRLPADYSFVEGATLPCAALTAWNCIHDAHPTGRGHVVVTQGTGGVSLFALQFAAAAGADVFATSSSEAKLERARALGASHLVNYRADPEWGKTARNVTGGRGVDLVVDVGGAGTIRQSIRAARMGGTIAVVGVVGGAAQEVSLPLIAVNSLRLIGVAVGNRAQFLDMRRAIERHRIRPVIDRTFPLDALGEAFEWVRGARHVGKVCIEID